MKRQKINKFGCESVDNLREMLCIPVFLIFLNIQFDNIINNIEIVRRTQTEIV